MMNSQAVLDCDARAESAHLRYICESICHQSYIKFLGKQAKAIKVTGGMTLSCTDPNHTARHTSKI